MEQLLSTHNWKQSLWGSRCLQISTEIQPNWVKCCVLSAMLRCSPASIHCPCHGWSWAHPQMGTMIWREGLWTLRLTGLPCAATQVVHWTTAGGPFTIENDLKGISWGLVVHNLLSCKEFFLNHQLGGEAESTCMPPKNTAEWERSKLCALLMGTQTGAATVENSRESPQKIKSGTSHK